MNSKQFDLLLERRFQRPREVLASKAAEYATDTDKLHNFKAAAAIVGMTLQKTWLGMWVKHIVSVLDKIKSGEPVTEEWCDEKLGDLINYLILLEAIYAESLYSSAALGSDGGADAGERGGGCPCGGSADRT